VAALVAALCSFPMAAAAQSSASGPPAGTDLDRLAERLVTVSAGVREGETVLISGRPHDAELLENLAVQVRRVGAFPLVTYSSDRLDKRLFFDVPARYDGQSDALGLQLAEMVDVLITLSNGTEETLFEGADPARMAARAKADEPVMQAFLRNNVRTVEIGNNLYPTAWRAERYGLEQAALARTFWQGVDVDHAALQSHGAKVQAALSAGGSLRITHPDGTDLSLQLGDRTVMVSDGVISDAEREAGGAAVSVYLPAGEVYTTPMPGTAEGTVVQRRTWFRGKPVDGLTMRFEDGRMVSMSGSGAGYADLKAAYDAVEDPRKDDFGFVDIGINPNVVLPSDGSVGNWVPAGTVTVGAGTNTWAGGDNSVPYAITAFLPGSTVTLDGKTLVDAGELAM
jgi:leucyl aminopeptidase (aminopeptidase T)